MDHNIIAGSFTAVGRGVNNGSLTKVSPRYTPYHVPHRTEIAVFMTSLHGDCKIFKNIFIQQEMRPLLKSRMEYTKANYNDWEDDNLIVGTVPYDNYPTFEEWDALFEGYCGMGSPGSDRYYTELPVWAAGNVYFNGAKPMKKEKDAIVDSRNKVEISYEEKDGKIALKTNLYDFIGGAKCKLLKTDDIAMAFEPEQKYENPDGTQIIFDTDILGAKRGENPIPGAFVNASDAQKDLF
ncbi:MAG: hypothetical protein J6Q47_00090 [Paludibacteraceae bacterium]|nr:hypothetical protein [Paludibacteraceae bacterium]